MKPVHVCVPVLKRYDLLRELLLSLNKSTVRPDYISVLDNGRDKRRIHQACVPTGIIIQVETPAKPLGLAESWNWFIDHVPEERFIVNDDITFAPDSLEKMLEPPEAFVSCSYGFSCFLLRDACVNVVGQFDESISPGYAYFEDMDYLRRMRLAGVVDKVVLCDVKHAQSATPQKYSQVEWDEHHRRFNIAQTNYINKWASNPSWEELKTIGGAGVNA